ncbi:armadillo-type protein [Sphaerosporella brunnea]|uniref:Armadillo-type protein n=1 Tax=Sphaerosporella brunnea TaxID=1250544 RepID=A0A5J5EGC2_9PEZI|nr:armadillo-type protein [Sphaerosporella brunnea]
MAGLKRKQDKSLSNGRKKPKVDSSADKKKLQKSTSKHSKKAAQPVTAESHDDEWDDEVGSSDDEEYGGVGLDVDGAMELHKPTQGDDSKGEKTAEDVAKARASRQEQKRLIAERKQAKPMGEVIQKSKKIWEQMRRKDISKEERRKKLEEHQQMIRGQIKDLVFKHDASRVVQTALKYGSKSIREEVAQELKGTYVNLAQSSYGKYLVVKAMHYGTPETKKMVADEFLGHVKKLIKHREACFVIEDIYNQFGTREQKARMVREFYGLEFAVFGKNGGADPSLKKILEQSPEKRAVIMKHLLELLTAVVGKGAIFFGIVHKAMLEYVLNVQPGTTDATEFVELVKEHGTEIAFTKDGAQVMMRCLALGNAKDRKAIIKNLKPVAHQMAVHENAHMLLLTLMDVVDDTVLVNKSIFTELQQHILDLATNRFGRIPLLYPFVGRMTRLLPPTAIGQVQEMDPIREATSKKDPEVRRSELRTHLSPAVLQAIADHAVELVQDSFGCQFIAEVLLGSSGDKSAALNAVAALATGDPNSESHVVATAAGGRMLKTLVAGGHYNSKEKRVELIDPPLGFHVILYNEIQDNINEWATGVGSFVVVSLLEASGFAQQAQLQETLRKHRNVISQAAEEGNKGCKVILEKL